MSIVYQATKMHWYGLPEQFVSNFDVVIDVLFMKQVPILHAVHKQTQFSRTAVIPKQDWYNLWNTFMTIWVILYFDAPRSLWVVQAVTYHCHSIFCTSQHFECNIDADAIKAHWSFFAERYHDLLLRIVSKLILDHPTDPLNLIEDPATLVMLHNVCLNY